MSGIIPPVEPRADDSSSEQERQARLEYAMLEASAHARRLQTRDHDQRYTLRWVALVVGLLSLTFMALFLHYMSQRLLHGPFLLVPSSFAIAAILAPIVSITTITIALFVASFRKFRDGDGDAMGAAAPDALRLSGLGG